MFGDDPDGPLAEQLGGINAFVSRCGRFILPQVQSAAARVEGSDGATADVSVVVLAACQVAWRTNQKAALDI